MEKKPKSVDRRVLKTKRAIRNAFAKLMVEKDINDITIMELANTADINRKTFYNYYTGVFQLVDELEDDILNKLQSTLKETDIIESIKEPLKLFLILNEAIGLNDPFLRNMLQSEKVSSFFNKFEDQMISLIRDEVARQMHTDPVATEYVIHFILAGEISVYKAWFKSDKNFPVEKLSEMINELAINGVRSLVDRTRGN